MKKFLSIFILLFGMFACKTSNDNIVQNYPEDPFLKRKQFAGNLFGNKDGIEIFKEKNKYDENTLWQKSIENISSILPISIADQQSGLIITDWGKISNISNNNSLYKINVIVKGTKIDEKNLQISVFKKKDNNDIDADFEVQDKIKKIILDNYWFFNIYIN